MMTFPDWSSFTPENVSARLPRLLAAAERDVSRIEEVAPTTYEGFVWALDDATRELWRCWGGVSHMLSVMNSPDWRAVEEEWQPEVVRFSLRVSQSQRLYNFSRNIVVFDPVRRRILDRMIQSAELSGVGLEGKKRERFNEIQMRLAQLGTEFHNAVIDATKSFVYEKGGKKYTIDDASYPETMKHCPDSDVRKTLFLARATRARENEARVKEILSLRHEEAKILGFTDYAELSLVTKCAPSVASALRMIDDLDRATVKIAERENEELGANLNPWDIAYEAERLRERKYAYSEEDLKRYFPMEGVLSGLFRLANFLFGVKIEEVPPSERPSVWHSDVRFYRVIENEQTLAHFYLDPFVRNGQKSGGAWMNEFRNRSYRGKGGEVPVLPLALICTNFPMPDENGTCLLPFREVETLFHEFGHALQQMLTRVNEEDAAGVNLIEWDAVEVASQFMENWCLDDRTGIVVPQELKKKVRAARNFRAANICRRQLAFAKTDLVLHQTPVTEDFDPNSVKTTFFDHFGLPTAPGDRFLCSFSHIFAGGYAAGYYGYKWAEVMSADCFGAFEEAGLTQEEKICALGRKYRETILALGGSKSALEVFRDFRGRDPNIASILRQQDLL